MPRVKRGTVRRAKRKKLLKRAKGFYATKSKLYQAAKEAVDKALNYAFSDPAALDFVAGLAESCEEAGQGLLLVAAGPNRSVDDGSAAVLSAGVDGFVVYSASDDDPYHHRFLVVPGWARLVMYGQWGKG